MMVSPAGLTAGKTLFGCMSGPIHVSNATRAPSDVFAHLVEIPTYKKLLIFDPPPETTHKIDFLVYTRAFEIGFVGQ